jgi:hypothetical protein
MDGETEAAPKNELKLADESKLLHIWTEVALGRGLHGGFLKAFAEAYVRADPANVLIMNGAARMFVVKFDLYRYLDNYKGE